MIPIKEGDITQTDHDIIVQQVNCLGVMGAGLAKTILRHFPNVKNEYLEFHRSQLQKNSSKEALLGMVNYVATGNGKTIANVFGQVGIRMGAADKKVYTVNEALLSGIRQVKEYAEANDLTVAIPTYIGCGLAGGDWSEIHEGIESIFSDSDVQVTLYHFRP